MPALALSRHATALAGGLSAVCAVGQPAAEHLYGEPFFTWLSHHPGQAERYTAAMANLTGGFKTAAIASLPLNGTHTIVDVGGADGSVLAAILAAHPHLRGVLFDLPHVITAALQTLARQGVEDRAECVGGDFFESMPAGGDAYLLSLVLHDWPDRQAQRILANIAAAGRGARLLVLDWATKNEWLGLLDVAGLELETLYGGFDGEPLDDDSREYVFVARRS